MSEQGWCRSEGIARGECGVYVLGGSWVYRGRGIGEVWGRRKGGKALVSCSPNSQLLSAEQVHKASLEGFGEGRQDETQPLMVNRSVPLDTPSLLSFSLPHC